MSKPTAEQVGQAVDLIKDHHRQYGAAATESRMSSLVYSIWSVLSGDGKPAAEHEQALENARQARKQEAAAATPAEPTPAPAPAPEPAPDAGPEPEPEEGDTYTEDELNALTVAQLKELAADGEVDLTGTTDKASIVAALMAAE